jgi:hypothetical protein
MFTVFGVYSLVSVGLTACLVANEIKSKKFLLEVIIALTTSKVNLVIFLNCLVVLLTHAANLLIYLFFGEIRPNESKVRFTADLEVSRGEMLKKDLPVVALGRCSAQYTRCLQADVTCMHTIHLGDPLVDEQAYQRTYR